MPRLLDRRILFFGGKGGVGKTTLAAEAREVIPRLRAMEIDPAAETDRYIAEVKARIEEVTSPRLLREVEREIDVARVSPGAEEAALFDRFAELMQLAGTEYDRVIFDTAPTGHTLRLLSLPEHLTDWIEGMVSRRRKLNALGRMWRNVAGAAAGGESQRDTVLEILERRRDKFRRARELVTDARHAAFAFVLIPERLPILEMRRAVEVLGRSGIPVGAVIVNRVLPAEAEGEFLARRRSREREYLAEIEDAFRDQHRIHLPLFDGDVHGIPALRRVIEALPWKERGS